MGLHEQKIDGVPQFVSYFAPVIEIMRDLGGKERCAISEETMRDLGRNDARSRKKRCAISKESMRDLGRNDA